MPIAACVRLAFVRGMARDDIDQFLLSRARQIRDRAVDRLFFHLRNLLHRQLALAAVGRRRLLVAWDELAAEPAKDVIGNAGGVPNVGILCESARFKALISKLLYQPLQ